MQKCRCGLLFFFFWWIQTNLNLFLWMLPMWVISIFNCYWLLMLLFVSWHCMVWNAKLEQMTHAVYIPSFSSFRFLPLPTSVSAQIANWKGIWISGNCLNLLQWDFLSSKNKWLMQSSCGLSQQSIGWPNQPTSPFTV